MHDQSKQQEKNIENERSANIFKVSTPLINQNKSPEQLLIHKWLTLIDN